MDSVSLLHPGRWAMTAPTGEGLRHLGGGVAVFPIGLGRMGMSGPHGPADEGEGVATIHAALDQGVNLIDTGDFYGSGHNEMLIGRALQGGRRDRVLLSVKFGALRSSGGCAPVARSPRYCTTTRTTAEEMGALGRRAWKRCSPGLSFQRAS